jgi:NifU-like protein involved in Fe-S cluster formation
MARLPAALQRHFFHPLHAGDPHGSQAIGLATNAACGDQVQIGLTAAADGAVAVVWAGRGCSAALACASLAAECVHGRSVREVRAFDLLREVDALGGLGPAQSHAVQVVARALEAALSKLAPPCQN